MRIWHGIDEYRKSPLSSTYVAMGVFDGVHRGHGELIKTLRRHAEANTGTPVVLTFDVHPENFTDKDPPCLLNYGPEKLARLSKSGLSAIIILEFSERMRDVEPSGSTAGYRACSAMERSKAIVASR